MVNFIFKKSVYSLPHAVIDYFIHLSSKLACYKPCTYQIREKIEQVVQKFLINIIIFNFIKLLPKKKEEYMVCP